MAGVNKVILIGNLGRDPEIRAMESGRKVANFSIATTEVYKDKNGERQEKTEWHNIVFWSPLADIVEKYVKKGSKLYIEGRLRTRTYEQDGIKKYITEIEGQTMTMLDSAGKNTEGTSSFEKPAAASVNSSVAADDDEGDLPF